MLPCPERYLSPSWREPSPFLESSPNLASKKVRESLQGSTFGQTHKLRSTQLLPIRNHSVPPFGKSSPAHIYLDLACRLNTSAHSIANTGPKIKFWFRIDSREFQGAVTLSFSINISLINGAFTLNLANTTEKYFREDLQSYMSKQSPVCLNFYWCHNSTPWVILHKYTPTFHLNMYFVLCLVNSWHNTVINYCDIIL